jgi:hypothetical protein
MKTKTAKELADELDAKDRLRERGYTWKTCKYCHGIGCPGCDHGGGKWQAPMTMWR